MRFRRWSREASCASPSGKAQPASWLKFLTQAGGFRQNACSKSSSRFSLPAATAPALDLPSPSASWKVMEEPLTLNLGKAQEQRLGSCSRLFSLLRDAQE